MWIIASVAAAQEPEEAQEAAQEQAPEEPKEGPQVDVGGYVETFYSWNFNDPANGVTNLRGYDNRHNTIALSNAALDTTGTVGPLTAKLVLQAGLTPNTYALAEPTHGAVSGVGESDRFTWRNVQQAWAAWQVADPVSVEAGLFLSPIGPESLAAQSNWNFSRSNLFYGLPAYHTGIRAGWQATDAIKLTGAVYNGWNSVVDNNKGKSLSGSVGLTTDVVQGQLLYFGGPERPEGAPEGQAWRHLGDLYVTITPIEALSILAHGDVGLEENDVGTNTWAGAALAARVDVVDTFDVAIRGDWFTEKATDGAGALFWPAAVDGVGRVASGTLTFDWHPIDQLSLRLEGRHDDANTAMFFKGDVEQTTGGADQFDADNQTTVTFAVLASI